MEAASVPIAETPPLLEFEHVHTYYGEIHILDDVSLQVGAGELVCLLGGNASGKSTTLKTVSRHRQAARRDGSLFEGEDVTDKSTSYRIGKGMAIVPENRRLFAPMSVLENLEMGAYLHGGGRKEDFDRVYSLFPLLHERRKQLAGHALRRRAADGRDGPRADVAAEAAADGRAVDGARSDPRRAELRDHPAGARVRRRDPRRRAERERLALDRRPRLRASRPGGSCSPGRPPRCSSTRTCGRPTLAVDVGTLPARIRHRFPVFEQRVYINSCSQGALSDSVRAAYDALPRRLGRARRAVGVLGRAARGGARQHSRAGQRRRGRDRGHDLGLGGRERARKRAALREGRDKVVVSDFEFPTIGQIWHAQERRGVRVVHVPAEADGTIPLERFEAAIDEQTALVAVTHVCFRNGSRLDVEAIARLAHERGAPGAGRRLPDRRLAPDRRRARSAATSSRRASLKYLLGSAGLGFLYCRRELVQGIEPDGDGLVRRPGHLRDGHPRLLARADGAPVRGGHAAGAVDLRGHRRDRADAGDRHRRDRGARAGAERDSCTTASRSSGRRVVTPRAPEQSGALVCVASTDVNALVAALGRRGHRHLVARRQPAHLGPLLQHRRGRGHSPGHAGPESRPARLT